MTNGTPIATFRDPAGSLSLEGDFAVRTIHPEARDQVMEFVTSPFCKRLQDRGDMVASTIKNTPVGLQLFHPRGACADVSVGVDAVAMAGGRLS